VENGVTSLAKKFPDYKIIFTGANYFLIISLSSLITLCIYHHLTGHSLGAATATIAAVELVLKGYAVYLYNYGSPRVGNQYFSDYVASLFTGDRIPQRITHYKDMVVHIPYESWGYVHISNEVYEDGDHNLHGCDGSEDNSCSDHFYFYQCNADDHMIYLNHSLSGNC
jgi:predicted lipase